MKLIIYSLTKNRDQHPLTRVPSSELVQCELCICAYTTKIGLQKSFLKMLLILFSWYFGFDGSKEGGGWNYGHPLPHFFFMQAETCVKAH